MKILYIEHYAGSPKYGMEYRPYYLAREWVKHGHEVTIVAASFAHLRSIQPATTKKASTENIDGIRYIWLNTPPYEGNGIGRIRNITAFLGALRHLPRILRGEQYDAVIASSTYPFDNGIVRKLARHWSAAHIYEVHDLWPLSPMELGGYSSRHPVIIATQLSEDHAYHHADAVVSLLPAAEGYMRSRGLAEGKFHYVPNGIMVEEWKEDSSALPREISDRLSEWARNRFLVCYAGAHGLANALDYFLDAARCLPEAGFVLVGKGPEKERLRAKAAGLDNVLFLDAVRKPAIPVVLGKMDALFIGLQRQSLFRFGISPNKLMDYLMASKPVVCAIEAGNDIVGDAHCGFTIKPEDPYAIIDAIKRLMALTPMERKEMGENGKRYVLTHHDYRVLAEQFLKIMAEAVGKKRSKE
jgi:glycosyltransferase involved in cell wall biosynthesis